MELTRVTLKRNALTQLAALTADATMITLEMVSPVLVSITVLLVVDINVIYRTVILIGLCVLV